MLELTVMKGIDMSSIDIYSNRYFISLPELGRHMLYKQP